MNRRRALRALASLPLSTAHFGAWAAPAAGSKLLVVFLRGGLDTASVLVPTGSDFYYEVRPNIAIARPGRATDSAITLDNYWGLHPVLGETLLPLWQRKELAIVAFAGTDDLSRSHFETQDSIEMGQGQGAARNFESGFLNRLASHLDGVKPIAFSEQLPLVMRGSQAIGNYALRTLARASLGTHQRELIAGMYAQTRFALPVREGFSMREEILHDLADEMDSSARGAHSSKGFAQDGQRMARLMSESFDLGFVDVGGWDTHVGQGGANGQLANRLRELGQGLAAFAQGMGAHWRNTTVIVMSEFGRTTRENGNRGTDHGHGTAYLVLGGSVRGGRVAGEQREISAAGLFQNRDLPVLNEYRAVLGAIFARQFALRPAQLGEVFPGVAPRELDLI